VSDTSSTAKSFTFPGLTNGTSYTFRVRAKATGDIYGALSEESDSVIPIDLNITNVRATSRDRAANVSWEDKSREQLTIRYRVTAYDRYNNPNDPIKVQDSSGSETSLIFDGLTNGTTYRFKVEAEDAVGNVIVGESFEFSNYVTPLGIPDKPVVESEDSKILVDWNPPANTDGIDHYTVTAFIYNSTFASTFDSFGTATNVVFTGLTNGTIYRFSVRAIGISGVSGGESVLSDYATPLDKPTDLLVTSGDQRVILDWEAPPGVFISGYRISRIIDLEGTLSDVVIRSFYGTNPETSFIYDELINGTTYNFRVRALVSGPTGYLEGDISDISIDVTPNPPPVAVLEGTLAARVTWAGFVAKLGTYRYKVNLMVVEGDHDGIIMSIESSPSANNLLYTGLTSDTIYQFSVIGLDINGNEIGTESGPSNFVTPEDQIPGSS